MRASRQTPLYRKEQFPEALASFLYDKENRERFGAVWAIVQECGNAERHFNQLQSAYRGLASTWLLATFAGVGYLFSKDSRFPDPYLMGASVFLAGGVGIRLIWMLDLGVYHQLLIAVFQEGYRLEKFFDWLPGLRTNMFNHGKVYLEDADPILGKLTLYYFVTAFVPGALGIVFTCVAYTHAFHIRGVLIGVCLLILIISDVMGFFSAK